MKKKSVEQLLEEILVELKQINERAEAESPDYQITVNPAVVREPTLRWERDDTGRWLNESN